MNLTYNEIMLVKYFRGTDERGKRAILNTAEIMFEDHPANKSKDNKINNNLFVFEFSDYHKNNKDKKRITE